MTLYPLHELWAEATAQQKLEGSGVERDGKTMVRACAAPLMLPETLGVRSEPSTLFCLACGIVNPDPGQREQAECAAEAEGAKVLEHGPPQPGTISDVARALLADGDLVEPNDRARKYSAAQRSACSELIALNLAEPGGKLTSAGHKLRDRVLSPEVPIDALRFDPAHAPPPVVEKKRKAKAAKAKSVAPMVCECGHAPRAHLRGERDTPCSECATDGKTCKRYRNVKPTKPEKKTKAKAA